jgi:uncharacterized membrane protein
MTCESVKANMLFNNEFQSLNSPVAYFANIRGNLPDNSIFIEVSFSYFTHNTENNLLMKKRISIKTESKELLRLETFSDGVFAIAITLLILELIQVLHYNTKSSLFHLLLDNWKSLVAFLIGFLTILICWINHHLVISYTQRTDNNLFWINGFVLLVVTFTPFPTAILAEYLEEETHHALAFFGFNYVMMSVAAYAISAYIFKRLVKKTGSDLLYYHTLLYKYSIAYTLVAFLVCFISIPVAVVLYLVLFIVFAAPKRFAMMLLKNKAGK